jgi:hypothetical protein
LAGLAGLATNDSTWRDYVGRDSSTVAAVSVDDLRVFVVGVIAMDTVSLPRLYLWKSTSLDMDSKRVSAIPAVCGYRSRNDITVYITILRSTVFVWTCIVGLSD